MGEPNTIEKRGRYGRNQARISPTNPTASKVPSSRRSMAKDGLSELKKPFQSKKYAIKKIGKH